MFDIYGLVSDRHLGHSREVNQGQVQHYVTQTEVRNWIKLQIWSALNKQITCSWLFAEGAPCYTKCQSTIVKYTIDKRKVGKQTLQIHYHVGSRPSDWLGWERCLCWSLLSCQSLPQSLPVLLRSQQTSFLYSVRTLHILHTKNTQRKDRGKRGEIREHVISRIWYIVFKDRLCTGLRVLTCITVDKLQNERSTGNDAWSSWKEVPDYHKEKGDRKKNHRQLWNKKLLHKFYSVTSN